MEKKYVTKLIVGNKEIDLLKYRFGFTKRVNIHKRPNQTASFRGLEMTVESTGDTFFEEWMLSEKPKPKIELHIYYPYLDEGSCQIMTFYDTYLTDHKTIFSSDNSEPMKEEIKLTCAGIKTPNAETQYTTSWRKTFNRESEVYQTPIHSPSTNNSVEELPKSKVLVNFRTCNNYKGEYGFDWIRMGDTGKPGDLWYKNIIGSYTTGSFVQSNTEYRKLGGKFEMPGHPTKSNDRYVVPVLALLKNKKAKLTLKLEIEGSDAGKIRFKYNEEYFNLDQNEITHKIVGKTELADYLTIECIKEFGEDQFIEVEADGKFAGKLKVIANDKVHRKNVNILLVKVKNNINDFSSLKISSRKKELTKYLNQALIQTKYEEKTIDINAFEQTDRQNFLNLYQQYDTNTSNNSAMDILNKIINGLGNKYTNYFKIYFIDFQVNGEFGETYGIGRKNNINHSVVILPLGFSDSTLAHETLHAMGLYHSFDDDGKLTFEEDKTDNIMDYSDIGLYNIPVISTWQWQWEIIRDNIN